MPKRLANTRKVHSTYDDLSVMVFETGYKKTWYSGINLGKEKTKFSSLRLPYDPDDSDGYKKALDAALPIYFDVIKRVEQGYTVTRKTFLDVCNLFAKSVKEKAEENEKALALGLKPLHATYGKRSFWNNAQAEHVDWVVTLIIRPFFQQAEYKNRNIESVTERDINAWQFWRTATRAKQLRKDWSVGTLNKQNRVLRQIFQFAQDEKMIDVIPRIQDGRESLRELRRPELSKEQYEMLLDHIRFKYQDQTKPQLQRIYQRLFYLWLVTIDATAMRPWKSEQNALKWSDITRELYPDGSVKIISIKRKEKGITYTAIADQHWSAIYDDIKMIHDRWGIHSDYLFAHPVTIEGRGIEKNAPIQNFRTQWRNAMDHFGWAKKFAKQQERISPYSLRHRYFHRRMLENKDIRIEELAQITGTSPKVIMETYWHFNVERKYEDFTVGGYELKTDKVRLYDESGILMGHAERGSKEHRQWHEEHPHIEAPS